MKKIIFCVILLSLTACGSLEREVASITGGGWETCHDGVAYVQFTSGTSVKYNTDGSIATCDK